MPRHSIFVRAVWDDEANVWVATSEDLPGLVAEADTVEALRAKVTVMASELIQLSGTVDFDLPEIPIHIFAEQIARIANPNRTTA